MKQLKFVGVLFILFLMVVFMVLFMNATNGAESYSYDGDESSSCGNIVSSILTEDSRNSFTRSNFSFPPFCPTPIPPVPKSVMEELRDDVLKDHDKLVAENKKLHSILSEQAKEIEQYIIKAKERDNSESQKVIERYKISLDFQNSKEQLEKEKRWQEILEQSATEDRKSFSLEKSNPSKIEQTTQKIGKETNRVVQQVGNAGKRIIKKF